ncbi:MAG: hypothetical protein KGI49_03065, partial [Patescibacteria group bacterium]|nr:hypothetical protein [Patescibacteria group bacterium]
MAINQSVVVKVFNNTSSLSTPTNNNSSVVNAVVNGNNLVLVGLSVGNASISTCDNDNHCGRLYVSVSTNGTVATTVNSNYSPAISSFTVSSNSSNGISVGSGTSLAINFSTNQNISTPVVYIG